jgi:hypothetical protein
MHPELVGGWFFPFSAGEEEGQSFDGFSTADFLAGRDDSDA